mmetsp:Transcript_64673/g.187430  ORF Transcript_64673/g.187430 Transcript_64673/m.187430 type:complete len:142 (-) Transcript_64673:367-792(-)
MARSLWARDSSHCASLSRFANSFSAHGSRFSVPKVAAGAVLPAGASAVWAGLCGAAAVVGTSCGGAPKDDEDAGETVRRGNGGDAESSEAADGWEALNRLASASPPSGAVGRETEPAPGIDATSRGTDGAAPKLAGIGGSA